MPKAAILKAINTRLRERTLSNELIVRFLIMKIRTIRNEMEHLIMVILISLLAVVV
jgi:hypothetical protein